MRMTLAPGEIFEHTHLTDSITTVVTGTVDLVVAGERTRLVEGVPTPIPANVSHVLVNVGQNEAIIECAH